MKQFNIIAFLVFLGGLVWVFFLKPETVRGWRSGFLGLFSPVVKAAGAVQGEAEQEDPRDRATLLADVKRLEQEVFDLRFRQRGFSELEDENRRLRADLEFRQNKRYDLTIPAQVIGRTRSSWWSTVTINRGRNHQVEKDLPVIDRHHGVVGKVTANGLTDETAEVLLLTDEQCRVAARVGRSVSMRGIVHGYRGVGNLTPEIRLHFLKPDIDLPAGAVLYTDDGEGQVFPPGMVVGTVVRQLKGELYDSAVVDSKVDFNKLNSVFVIRMASGTQGEDVATANAETLAADVRPPGPKNGS